MTCIIPELRPDAEDRKHLPGCDVARHTDPVDDCTTRPATVASVSIYLNLATRRAYSPSAMPQTGWDAAGLRALAAHLLNHADQLDDARPAS